MTTLNVGRLADPNQRFCPFAAVAKWPYRHLHGEDSELVSDTYFANGKLRARGWTIYYIDTLLGGKPLLLIPSNEVEALFLEIHKTLNIYRGFPDITRHPGFEVDFEVGPRPRYLGRLTADISLTDLEDMIPNSSEQEPKSIDDASFPAFRRKMEAMILAGKNRQKNARDKKRQNRVVSKRGWCAQLKRAQCYLGLRPRGTANKEDFINNPNHTYEESQAAQEAYEKAAGLKLPNLVPNDPAPCPFDQKIVFVCVDVEAYEKDHKKITEIGISTLDTLDLADIPPGEGGSEWMKKIRARHFRIGEHGHLRNTDFVGDAADNFVKRFGTSEWISIKEAPQVVASCFRHPFSAPGQYYPYPDHIDKVGRNGSGSQYLPPIDENRPKRNIVLVGHDIQADIEFLRNIGYEVSNLPNLLEAVDTADLFRAMKHEQQTRSLASVLLELELVGWHLHNAGNDAGYTLEALIGISIAALNTTHKTAPDPEQLDAAAAEAQARLIEEIEEWEIADEEGGDGGAAVKVPSYEKMMDKRAFDQGLRRANKAEDFRNKKYAFDQGGSSRGGRGGSSRGSGSNRGRGRGLGSAHTQDFPALKPSLEKSGETKFHAANEQRMRETADRPTAHAWAKTENQAKPKNGKNKDAGGGVPLPNQKMQDRLQALDDVDEYFTM